MKLKEVSKYYLVFSTDESGMLEKVFNTKKQLNDFLSEMASSILNEEVYNIKIYKGKKEKVGEVRLLYVE